MFTGDPHYNVTDQGLPRVVTRTTDPTVNDDISQGFKPLRSKIYNTVNGKSWLLVDGTVGVAVWEQTNLEPDDLASVAVSGDYNDLINTPNLASVAVSGDYNDLINTPNLATVATSGDYNDLIGTPALADVATSGLLKDLTDLSATAQAPGSGQDGYALVWDNGSSEYTLSNIGGDVTKVGTPVNNQLGIWTGDGTLEGVSDLTFDGTSLYVDNGAVYARNANDFNSGYAILGSFSGSGLTFGLQNSTATDQGVISVENITDSGTTPVLIFETGSTVATRPLMAGYNNGTKHFEVDASGNWEIQNDLAVLGDSTFTGGATFGSGTSGSLITNISNETISDGEFRRFIVYGTHNSNSRRGDIGVHTHASITNACSYIFLQAEDGQGYYKWVGNSGNYRISTSSSNIGTTSGTVIGTQTSDIRLKNVDKKFKGYGLNEALKLADQQIRFFFNYDKEQRHHLGFSAQAVKEIIPEAVYNTHDEKDGIKDVLAMYSTELIPVAFSAIKESHEQNQSEIEVLRNRVKELEEEIKLLKAA
ncbi:hypothetical protein [Ekhidna sp.]|jgi:hypothetical protein|uniref:tail fiber domain-containing protein n=1 Tax=Ekhidna sp. TaxID=2608089 RepID=UPI0032EE5324